MTAPALPPEVDAALGRVLHAQAVLGYAQADATSPHDLASRDAQVAVLVLRTAIARALGGDGEPVGPDAKAMIEAIRLIGVALGQGDDWVDYSPALVEFAAERIRALYTRPAATGDTGEGEKARAELSAALARLTDDERAVLPLNVQEDARPRVKLAHIESDEGAPAGQGIAVVSVPAKYARLAWAMVCAINAATRAATGGPDAR